MAIESETLRSETDATLKEDGALFRIRRPVYEDDKRVGEEDVFAWGLQLRTKTTAVRGDTISGSDLKLLLSALASTEVGELDGNLLNLQQGHLLEYEGGWAVITNPGAFRPAKVTIFYKPEASIQTLATGDRWKRSFAGGAG